MMNAFTRATDALTSVLPFRSGKPKAGTRISPLAVVDPRAIIGEGCEIGPFCVVGSDVILGTGNKLLSHVVVTGHTTIGRDNVFHPHSVIGGAPQDKKYRGEATGLQIGDRNQIREVVTIHTGTEQGGRINGGGVTRVGSDNLLMVNCHIGHDAQIGDGCVLANNVMIAGHIVVGDHVILNGGVGINAFVTIGSYSYVAGYARIHHDIPPFVKVSDDARIRGLNGVGLKRAGFTEQQIAGLEEATRSLFGRRKPQSVAVTELEGRYNGQMPQHVRQILDFLKRRNAGKHGRYLESLR
ncbi:MAG: acyl-ACP--UDP-N-acetylglucosamine O-acyltransferase [Anaerolineae bacterium]|nr:acyl-ACP--UDP-N-acetylglucosamine O-acyltransferase [Phycisphaerae bacterium]